MRLLACFASRKIVLDDNDALAQLSRTRDADRPDPRFERATAPVPDPSVFVPTTVAELHPEYAHSEPYCFAAKTDSARVLVQRSRDKRALSPDAAPPVDPPEFGTTVVVRGPTYNSPAAKAKKPNEPPSSPPADEPPMEEEIPRMPVELMVEMPGSIDPSFVDSDDQGESENISARNFVDSTRNTSDFGAELSVNSKTSISAPTKKEKARSKRAAKPSRTSKTRKSKSRSDIASTKRENARRKSDAQNAPGKPEERYRDREPSNSHLDRDADNTPKELLVPIRVPRLSHARDHSVSSSPALSSDSWAPNNSSERYEDVEGDGSSSFLRLATVGKEKIVHKASHSQEIPTIEDGEEFYEAATSLQESNGVRSKRKSKPFLPGVDIESSDESSRGMIVAPAPVEYSLPIYGDRIPITEMESELPPLTALPRQRSLGTMSDDSEAVETPPAEEELFPLPSPATKLAALQRVQHDELLNLPKASASNNPVGIMRRSSSTKRKTVSFRDESPVIIEPNLTARVPSKSVPRNAVLSRESESDGQSNVPSALRTTRDPVREMDSDGQASLPSALRKTRDSVRVPVQTAPTMDLDFSHRSREYSDNSSASEDTFQSRSSRRMSRVSIKDKDAVRMASKRQSQAVAKAMAEQIRGVPKSAMLAFSENEVLYSEDDNDDSDPFAYNGEMNLEASISRRARSTKSIRLPPVVVPGVVPQPPPPPPFSPGKSRVQSVRSPPPPPVSPIRY